MTMIQNSRQLVAQISQRPGAQQGQQPPPSQGVPPPAPGGAPAPPPAPSGGPPGGLPPPPGVMRPAGFGGNLAGTGGNAVPVRPTPRNPSGGANPPAAPPNLPGPAGAPMPPPMPPVTAGGASSLFPPSGSGGGGSDMAGLASQFASFGVGGGSQPSNTGPAPLPPTRYGQTSLVLTFCPFKCSRSTWHRVTYLACSIYLGKKLMSKVIQKSEVVTLPSTLF